MTTLYLEDLMISGAMLGPENPLPFFRSVDQNRPVSFDKPVPDNKKERAGWQTGFRVLPYRMQDTYTRQRRQMCFRTIVLENEYLKATFLPSMGGRLLSLVYKPEDRELLSHNPIFQPGNLAIRNAWFAGGIEWNIGQLGHTFTTCSSIFAARIQGTQDEPGLRLYEYERCKGLFWQVDLYLPPGSPFLIAYYCVINPNQNDSSMYWWTNIAVPESQDSRILAPGKKTIFIHPGTGNHSFGYADLPFLPSTQGKDASYPTNFEFSSEYFFQPDGVDMPWETSLDRLGSGLIEASTPRLAFRKMFCWGMHPGGRRWQDFLCGPDHPYVEIQAGLAPTQLHGLNMPAKSRWDWVQAFGFFRGDPARVHDLDYERASAYVDAELKKDMNAATLSAHEKDCRILADCPPQQILWQGSGWGALELARRVASRDALFLKGLVFPKETLGEDQKRWLMLLEQNRFPDQSPSLLPGEWMVQEDWRLLLAVLPEKNWFSLLHEGVMEMEQGAEAEAVRLWQASLQDKPSAWAHRNLAVACQRLNQPEQAMRHYQQAWDLLRESGGAPVALALEILHSLCNMGQFENAMQVYKELPIEVQQHDRVQILLGRIALELEDLHIVEHVLQREYAVILEGEVELTDLWFGMWERRISKQTGRPVDEALRIEIRQHYAPPANIDFRMS